MGLFEVVTERVQTAWKVFVHEPEVHTSTKPMPAETSYNELYEFMEVNGFTYASGTEYTAAEARSTLSRIMNSDGSPELKYDALHALDVRVGNQTVTDQFKVTNEILAAQYELIKEMEKQ